MNEEGSCPPIAATVDCFRKNGEVVYRSGNGLAGLTTCGTEAMTRELETPPAKTFIDAACWKPGRSPSLNRTFQLFLPHRATPWRYGGDCRTLGFAELLESADSVPR
jgi:hypothetical protein